WDAPNSRLLLPPLRGGTHRTADCSFHRSAVERTERTLCVPCFPVNDRGAVRRPVPTQSVGTSGDGSHLLPAFNNHPQP
ncbi:MAG: hypothetical protein JXA28_14085, partial [Bacteroidetes bacterium]|nr:hypothetical protein [Bacteroidota bacterium]